MSGEQSRARITPSGVLSLCARIGKYVGSDPSKLEAGEAVSYLQHAADCEQCAELLRQSREHGLRVLAGYEPTDSSDVYKSQERDAIVGKAQLEYVMFAEKVLERLTPGLRDKLAMPGSLDHEVFSHVDPSRVRSPAVRRLALAQVEASSMLSTLIGAGAGTMTATGDLRLEDRTVPSQYFASVLEDFLGFFDPTVWRTMVGCVVDGHLGMPGLAETDRSEGSVELRVERDSPPSVKVDLTG